MIRTLFAALFLAVLVPPALAVNPDEVLANPALEARARHLSANLRCLVCQNQSIDDSNAELAKDLRLLLRERIMAGDSDDEVIAYIVSRYGEFVLLKPPLNSRTMLLWSAPFVLLALGGIVLFVSLRNRRAAGPAVKLSAEEQARLDKILGE